LPWALVLVLSACATKKPSQVPDRDAVVRMAAADTRPPEQLVFEVGAGMADITGPAAQVMLMGYVNPRQVAQGIHQRLRSRAFVIVSPRTGKRVVFVSADLVHLYQAVKQGVVAKLQAHPELKGLYTDENVLLSATHTHAGPGGFSHYDLYNLSFRIPGLQGPKDVPELRVLGFVRHNYEAIVDGIYASIVQAHQNLAPGHIRRVTGELEGASHNRSRDAYARNPQADREGRPDVDTTMTLLRLDRPDGAPVGVITWFAIHPTSMSNRNRLISGDNKGYASYLFEKELGTDYAAPSTFVAAFAQSNEGDVSPFPKERGCTEFEEDVAATQESGHQQYTFARNLYEVAKVAPPLSNTVDFRHTYVKMDEVQVAPPWSEGPQPRQTCKAALGRSMLAGTEDGRGVGKEGVSCENPPDVLTIGLCANPEEQCQAPKPVVLNMGRSTPPMSPEVLPLQLLTLGELTLAAVPFEMTTMAGRKLREGLLERLKGAGVDQVVIAGLSNAYAGYLATRAEYTKQDYEGGSTHFGPWTLGALRQGFDVLAHALATGAPADPGPTPRVIPPERLPYAELPELLDEVPAGARIGDLFPNGDAQAEYTRGKEEVKVVYWGANPRNDFREVRSFLEVQRKTEAGWTTVAYDWDWETFFEWGLLPDCPGRRACSHATLTWKIPQTASPGTYRLVYNGRTRVGGDMRAFSTPSREFTVK
jgi:neutral ceramidase